MNLDTFCHAVEQRQERSGYWHRHAGHHVKPMTQDEAMRDCLHMMPPGHGRDYDGIKIPIDIESDYTAEYRAGKGAGSGMGTSR